MRHLVRIIFWWLAVPLLIITLLGAVSYIRTPQALPPLGEVSNPNLRDVMATLRGLFIPLFGNKSASTNADGDPLPILMYHYIRDNVDQNADPLGYGLSVPPDEFEAQLRYLSQNGYTTVTMEQVARGQYGPKSVALTFDDGYQDFISEAYPLLEQFGFTATVYIITNRLQDSRHLSEDDIVYLANRGIAFGSHSVTHSNLTRQSSADLRQELLDSKTTLSRLTDKEVTALSYPAGQYTEDVVTVAREVGYATGVTVVEGTADPRADQFRLARIRIRHSLSQREFSRKLTQTAVSHPPTGTDRSPAF